MFQSSSRWITALVLIFGGFMSFLDQTIVNIAVPVLQRAFQADLQSVQWVITSYMLTQGALIPTMPFLTARLGSKRCYLFSLALFTAGSALCAFAWTLPALILFRVLQGVGGALLMPLSMSILLNTFPLEERGRAMTAFSVPALAAPALGPIIGGYLVTIAPWPVIFLINVPIGILAVILASIFLPGDEMQRATRFDIPGFLTATYGVAAVLYACSEISNTGWASPKVPGFLFSGLVALTLFIVIELLQARRGKRPLLDIRILTDRSLSAGLVASTVLFICLFSNSLLFPIYLQTLRGQTALQASLLLLPLALGTLVSMTLAGRLVDRLPDARVLIVPGIVLQILGMVLLMGITLTTPYWQFCLMVGLLGLANGLVMQPLSVASMVSIHSPEAVATGTTLSTVLRSVGGSLGTAVLATLTMMPAGQTRLVQLVGLHTVFLITIGLMVLALLFVLLLRKKQEKPTSQAEPATV